MNLNKQAIIYKFLKNNLSLKIKHYLYSILHFRNNLKIRFGNFILNFLITDIYDENKKIIFTLRNFGGSTVSRGFSMFRSQPEVPKWIDTFGQNSVLIDIGANIGLFSLYAAKKKHKVIAIEPESLNFACLNLNIKDNDLNDKISAFPIALNDKFEISNLNLSVMKFGGSGSTFDRQINDRGEYFCPIYKQGSISCTLDDFLEKTKTVPNYIKIDVDGNELKVIQGMTETLKKNELKSICIELNPDFKEHQEVVKILNDIFKRFNKNQWYQGQKAFNHIFYKNKY